MSPDDPGLARRFCDRVISAYEISNVPPTAIPKVTIALVIMLPPRTQQSTRIANRNTRYRSPLSSPNVATPFIDHSSEMWNFHYNGPLSRCPLLHEKGEAMRKTLMALAAVATLAVSAVAAPQAAEARGGRIAAGIAAGVIGSAIVGGAIASQRDYYGSGYYGPAYGYCGGTLHSGESPLACRAQRV